MSRPLFTAGNNTQSLIGSVLHSPLSKVMKSPPRSPRQPPGWRNSDWIDGELANALYFRPFDLLKCIPLVRVFLILSLSGLLFRETGWTLKWITRWQSPHAEPLMAASQKWKCFQYRAQSDNFVWILLRKTRGFTLVEVELRWLWVRLTTTDSCLLTGPISKMADFFWSYSKLVKYGCFEMASDPTYNPKASAFD